MSAVSKIIADLDWRGPNDKQMGHVVLTREQAEEVLEHLRGNGANRYWEGRWRDEKADTQMLWDSVAEKNAEIIRLQIEVKRWQEISSQGVVIERELRTDIERLKKIQAQQA